MFMIIIFMIIVFAIILAITIRKSLVVNLFAASYRPYSRPMSS